MDRRCFLSFLICAALLLSFSSLPAASAEPAGEEEVLAERISAEDARAKVEAGEALLVCAYGDKKCRSRLLEGAILKSELKQRLDSLPKDQEIIFYCGWPSEKTSARVAAHFENRGFTNVKALEGGIDAWKASGYPMKQWSGASIAISFSAVVKAAYHVPLE